jgi:hypothetical protein
LLGSAMYSWENPVIIDRLGTNRYATISSGAATYSLEAVRIRQRELPGTESRSFKENHENQFAPIS